MRGGNAQEDLGGDSNVVRCDERGAGVSGF